MKFVSHLCAVVLLLAPSVRLAAHHSAAAFDTKAEITVMGTVTDWRWANPHVILKFDVKNDAGTVTPWAAEAGNPTTMRNQGWARTSFKAGDDITVTLRPARNGEPVGQFVRVVVLATGQAYVTFAPGSPSAAKPGPEAPRPGR